MKKIKPQFGKVAPPTMVKLQEDAVTETVDEVTETIPSAPKPETKAPKTKVAAPISDSITEKPGTVASAPKDPNPFLQTKDAFAKARLTKIGYRMRSDYVELLDIVKKLKKSGYTLEAVLDDALTHYFENSEDGREAIRKAELFYS